MNYIRATIIAVSTYIPFTIALSWIMNNIVFGVGAFETTSQGVLEPTSQTTLKFWAANIVFNITMASIGYLWFIKDKHITPNRKNGLYYGLILLSIDLIANTFFMGPIGLQFKIEPMTIMIFSMVVLPSVIIGGLKTSQQHTKQENKIN